MALQAINGLIIGLIFGYALQRTGITKYPRVTGMLLLKDFKILKFMLTAVTFSMVGFYTLSSLGIIELNPKPLDWGKVVGGLIFGAGMGLLGYCPGSMIARIGEAKKDAWIGLLGMVQGVLFFAVNVKFFKAHLMTQNIPGNLPSILGVNKWIVIPIAALVFIGIILLASKVDDFKKNF